MEYVVTGNRKYKSDNKKMAAAMAIVMGKIKSGERLSEAALNKKIAEYNAEKMSVKVASYVTKSEWQAIVKAAAREIYAAAVYPCKFPKLIDNGNGAPIMNVIEAAAASDIEAVYSFQNEKKDETQAAAASGNDTQAESDIDDITAQILALINSGHYFDAAAVIAAAKNASDKLKKQN